jgi:hypothetical protein
MLSCKANLLTTTTNLTRKYNSTHFTLTINQDSTIIYEDRMGRFPGTFEGKWIRLDDKTIQLTFPDCTDIIELLGPNMCGRKVRVEVVRNGALKMESTILTRLEN